MAKKTIVHVNQHRIKSNHKHNLNEPVLTCKSYKGNQYGHEAHLKDKEGNVLAKFIYNEEKPLSCGARVWFETNLDVEVINHADNHRQ